MPKKYIKGGQFLIFILPQMYCTLITATLSNNDVNVNFLLILQAILSSLRF